MNNVEYTNQAIKAIVQTDGKILIELEDPSGKEEELKGQLLDEFLNSGAITEKMHEKVQEKMQAQQKVVGDIVTLLQSYNDLDERGKETLVNHAKSLVKIMQESECHA